MADENLSGGVNNYSGISFRFESAPSLCRRDPVRLVNIPTRSKRWREVSRSTRRRRPRRRGDSYPGFPRGWPFANNASEAADEPAGNEHNIPLSVDTVAIKPYLAATAVLSLTQDKSRPARALLLHIISLRPTSASPSVCV